MNIEMSYADICDWLNTRSAGVSCCYCCWNSSTCTIPNRVSVLDGLPPLYCPDRNFFVWFLFLICSVFISNYFSGTPHELATEHWQRMIHATRCRKPMPRVVPISHNASKRYDPYATILHRCGEDTGCCGSTASVCTVKTQETVMVYVFVSIPNVPTYEYFFGIQILWCMRKCLSLCMSVRPPVRSSTLICIHKLFDKFVWIRNTGGVKINWYL